MLVKIKNIIVHYYEIFATEVNEAFQPGLHIAFWELQSFPLWQPSSLDKQITLI